MNVKTTPDIIYKFRCWGDKLHKSILRNRELWFAHPFHLNDQEDMRQQVEIHNIEGLTSYDSYRHLWDCLTETYPETSKKYRKIELDRRFKEIRSDPVSYFLNGIAVTEANKEHYGIFGVLSLTDKVHESEVWERYGDDHRGFCVGFKTQNLIADMGCLDGPVEYSDLLLKYDPLKIQSGEEIAKGFFKKTMKWQNESEYRFLTARIETDLDRRKHFSIDTVAEVVLGRDISSEDEVEIKETISKNFDKDVPIFKFTRHPFQKVIIR